MINQIVKDKMAREIMVVPTQELFRFVERKDGFLQANQLALDYIKSNYIWMIRGRAEEDPNFKQPIPYGVLMNSKGEIFLYKRGGRNSNAGEKRLHEKLSIGVGGHIERADIDGSGDPLMYSFRRELLEEIGLESKDIDDITLIGFVNDDSNEVGKVHIGVVFLVKVKDNFYPLMADGELQEGKFMPPKKIKEIVKRGGDMETWSQIILSDYF